MWATWILRWNPWFGRRIWNPVIPSSNYRLYLLQVVTGSTTPVYSYIQFANWSASCQLGFAIYWVYLSSLFHCGHKNIGRGVEGWSIMYTYKAISLFRGSWKASEGNGQLSTHQKRWLPFYKYNPSWKIDWILVLLLKILFRSSHKLISVVPP